MCKFIKRIFQRYRTEVIRKQTLSHFTTEQVLSAALGLAATSGPCSKYKCVKEFCEKYPAHELTGEVAIMVLPELMPTNETVKFAKKFHLLHCKSGVDVIEDFLNK